MTKSIRDEAHAIYQLRRKKYSLTREEIIILKEIFNDEDFAKEITLNDDDFIYDETVGYKRLALRFKEKLDAIRKHNDAVYKHGAKKYFSIFFTINTRRLETALTHINYHTKNLIALEDVSSALTYDEDNKLKRKEHNYNPDNSFVFSAVNLISTLQERAKHFLFIPFGQIARLAEAFEKKIASIKKTYQAEDITLKLNKNVSNSNRGNLLQRLQTNAEHILPHYSVSSTAPPIHLAPPVDRLPQEKELPARKSTLPEPKGIVLHEELKVLLENASPEDKRKDAFQQIEDIFFNRLINTETQINFSNFAPRNKFITFSLDIIALLKQIITVAKPHAAILKDRTTAIDLTHPANSDPDLPHNKNGYNIFDEIIDHATRDINAIKGLAPYTRLLNFRPYDIQQRQLREREVIISPLPEQRLSV